MRLISLVITLVIISGLVVYYKNSLLPTDKAPQQTVKEQARQIIDNAKNATTDMQKQMEEEQKRLDQYSK
jgi:parvulin-like peptidyl-prolyl isomerase